VLSIDVERERISLGISSRRRSFQQFVSHERQAHLGHRQVGRCQGGHLDGGDSRLPARIEISATRRGRPHPSQGRRQLTAMIINVTQNRTSIFVKQKTSRKRTSQPRRTPATRKHQPGRSKQMTTKRSTVITAFQVQLCDRTRYHNSTKDPNHRPTIRMIRRPGQRQRIEIPARIRESSPARRRNPKSARVHCREFAAFQSRKTRRVDQK